jgi:transcriptional regulator with XRE-family HTH domain
MADSDMKIADLPPLDEDQEDDACFRARDRAWSALVDRFTAYQHSQNLNYEQLGRRIGRTRSQVQRWLRSSFNMNLRSLGLLAEGLDADLIIDLAPRHQDNGQRNYCHPAEAARSLLISRAKTTSTSAFKDLSPSATLVTSGGSPLQPHLFEVPK